MRFSLTLDASLLCLARGNIDSINFRDAGTLHCIRGANGNPRIVRAKVTFARHASTS
jgi:hypothetical protein